MKRSKQNIAKMIADNANLGSLSKSQSNKKLVATVDGAPSWESLSQQMIEWIQSGNSEQHQQASEMIFQMAKISDAYRENQSLFEASGDMYVALKRALRILEASPIRFNGTISKIKRAIAKAKGKKTK